MNQKVDTMHAYQGRFTTKPATAERRPAPLLHAGAPAAPTLASLSLSAEESARFVRIVSGGALISRHDGVHEWLSGEVQQVLPHRILFAAWGDFAKRHLALDVVSSIPGVSTAQAVRCGIDDVIRKVHAEWVQAGRQPVLLNAVQFEVPRACLCPVHAALRRMHAAVAHGVRDRRSGNESLYIAFDTEPLGAIPRAEGFKFLVDCLIAQMDVAFRRIAEFAPGTAAWGGLPAHGTWRELSRREREILSWLCRGESNVEIAAALDISPHTVKNHLQRIFRKIGVNNRTQAAARYGEAMRAAGENG
ncbi:MAG TPA: XrtB/PEP-CTERM-associated transcriptional regulator EpsA [Burkholderiales bacterium]|nr:XrtB/PEP-CTERM-associated transcriptional regulator EpsA [Burkholderiales bacterium]